MVSVRACARAYIHHNYGLLELVALSIGRSTCAGGTAGDGTSSAVFGVAVGSLATLVVLYLTGLIGGGGGSGRGQRGKAGRKGLPSKRGRMSKLE